MFNRWTKELITPQITNQLNNQSLDQPTKTQLIKHRDKRQPVNQASTTKLKDWLPYWTPNLLKNN